MAGARVLTDGAKFKCQHMPTPIGKAQGITISLVATKISVDGAAPILSGATISGFTKLNGCTYETPTTPPVSKPCESFTLPPATGLLMESGVPVYTEADLTSIAFVNSSGNVFPGLTITETQQKLRA